MGGLAYHIREELCHYVINTIYVVFMGVIFASLFDVRAGKLVVNISGLGLHNALLFSLVVTYFMVDWFSSNAVADAEDGLNHFVLLGYVLAVGALGIGAMLSLGSSVSLLWLGMYSLVVPFMDVFLYFRQVQARVRTGLALPIVLGFMWRFGIGLLLLILGAMYTFVLTKDQHKDAKDVVELQFIGLLSLYLLAKIVRYLVLARWAQYKQRGV